MLTSPIALSIPKEETAHTDSFPVMYERVCANVVEDGYSYIIAEQRPEIYKAIQMLKSFSANTNAVASTSIVQWVQTLACCPTGYMLGDLLKVTALGMLAKPGVFNLKQCNLEQSLTILSHLDKLLLSQARDRQLYSRGDSTQCLTDMAPVLRVLILRCVAMGKNVPLLSPTQISILLGAMAVSPFILKEEEADAVFTVLAQHIQENTAQQHHFSDTELKHVFVGLEYSQERDSVVLESLMDALLPSLYNATMDNPKDGVLACIMNSLKYRPSNAITIAIVEKATVCIHTYTEAQQWLNAEAIARIFAGLAAMGENAATETLLIALLPHVNQLAVSDPHDGVLSYRQRGRILEGLEYFAGSTTAVDILKKITLQLAVPLPLHGESSTHMNRKRWLANAIYSLSNYLDASASAEAQQCAVDLINKAVEVLDLKPKLQQENLEFTIAELANARDRGYFIMKIGNFTNHWALEVNLSGYTCSRALLWFIADFIAQLEDSGMVAIPPRPRYIHFNCIDDNVDIKSFYNTHEMQWTRAMFGRFYRGEVGQEGDLGSPSSLSSDASSASCLSLSTDGSSASSSAAQGSDEDMAGAAAAL